MRNLWRVGVCDGCGSGVWLVRRVAGVRSPSRLGGAALVLALPGFGRYGVIGSEGVGDFRAPGWDPRRREPTNEAGER